MNEGVYAIILDGVADAKLARLAESKGVAYVVAKTANTGNSGSTKILTVDKL